MTRTGLLASAALLAATLLPAAASAQTSYPLICRGGDPMRLQVAPNGTTWLTFQPGTAAGATTPPGPGTCTWLDRGFRTGEPARMRVTGNRDWTVYLLDGMTGGAPFFAHVYNNGTGDMVVTRIGP